MKLLINNADLSPSTIFNSKADYERWERRQYIKEFLYDILSTVIACIMLVVFVIMALLFLPQKEVKAKEVKISLGTVCCSGYTPSSNTPAGTRNTATGIPAVAGWTVAVDAHNPIVPLYSIVEINGHRYKVLDTGGFDRLGRDFDIFHEDGIDYGVQYHKAYLIRQETKKEKKERLQKCRFILQYNPSLAPWQIITDKDIISGGTVRIGLNWLDVVKTYKHMGRVIKTGNWYATMCCGVYLDEVCEEAVG